MSFLRGKQQSKQQLSPVPLILIIGNDGVGKKTFVAHLTGAPITSDFEKPRFAMTERPGEVVNVATRDDHMRPTDQHGEYRPKFENMKSADGIIIVFDITNQKSFEDVKAYLAEIERYNKNSQPIESIHGQSATPSPILLIANKVDQEHHRKVPEDKIKELADSYGLQYQTTSLKNEANAHKIFNEFANSVKEGYEPSPSPRR